MNKVTDKLKKLMLKRGLDENGKEIMDSTPNRIKLGIGTKKQEPLHLMVKRMVRENANALAMEQGDESFEEANDFDIDGDLTIETPYESNFDTQVPDTVLKKHIDELNKRYVEANKNYEELLKKQNKGKQDENDN